jgi:serine/threonine-protein kinase
MHEHEPPHALLPASATANEHRSNLLRLRMTLGLGAFLWLSFIAADALMDATLYPGIFRRCLWVRLSNTALQLLFLGLLYRKPAPSARTLRWIDLATFVSASVSMGALVLEAGGLSGAYTPSIFFILIWRNASLMQPWRSALVPNALIALSHILTLLVGEWLRPGAAFTVGPTNSVALLVLHSFAVTLAVGFMTAASHSMWALRRRVFEARGLGRFRLVSRIAEGGHGEVWRAFDSAVRQHVAIKVLRGDMVDDARAVVRFEREIDALCKLSHPHTIRILDFGVSDDGVAYYAMELLHGGTLAELVAREGPLPPVRVVHLLLQAAHALSEAHQQAIVHRDIKPENLFVLRSELALDFVKVLDFGIARHNVASSGSSDSLTRTGMVIGTPAFMAPEVAAGLPASARADVYGLGAVAYFLLYGSAPVGHDAHNEAASRGRISAQPGALEALVSRCLTRDPEQRYADAGELARALEALPEAHAWKTSQRPDWVAEQPAPTHTLESSARP